MERLVQEQKDYYNDEDETYQISLYYDETTNEVNTEENFSEEKKSQLKLQKQKMSQIELLLLLFQKPDIQVEVMQEGIRFSSTLLKLKTLSDFPRHEKFAIINFFVILLHALSKRDPKKFTELGEIFFQETLPKLNYHSEKYYEEIDQGLLGIVRSDYYHLSNLESAQAIKRLKTRD